MGHEYLILLVTLDPVFQSAECPQIIGRQFIVRQYHAEFTLDKQDQAHDGHAVQTSQQQIIFLTECIRTIDKDQFLEDI